MSLLSRLAKKAAELATEKGAKRAAEGAGKRVAEDAALRVERRAAPLAVKPKVSPLAVKPKTAPRRPLALPAPQKPLALPAPGPGLPDYAAKPRGGQWWINREIGDAGGNISPEYAVAQQVPPGLRFSSSPEDLALRDWFEKAAAKYIKNDFATPNDPMRDLAARGLLHIPDMGPDEWSTHADSALLADKVGDILLPRNPQGGMPGAGDDLRGQAMVAMPWLAKQPVTDPVWGVQESGLRHLEFGHVADELRNAMTAEAHGIPADLAVRPESLTRMSFPQAVERVGRINQWRAKQAEQAQLSAMNSPAVHTFKEYPENNPLGLRWVELKAPDMPEGYFIDPDTGDVMTPYGSNGRPGGAGDPRRPTLEEALRYEGDTMGHCVGGYCDDVMSGRSRIFSLRDAKGEPHVTIETSPRRFVFSDVRNVVGPEQADAWMDEDVPLRRMGELAGLGEMQDIIQIKGKQNRAPKDDYLPFVQDFVKSQQWGNIGDLGNTGLVKLPDGRYITQGQFEEGLRSALRARAPEADADRVERWARTAYPAPSNLTHEWRDFAPHFEGYAVGGRVEAGRCFSYNPLSVRRG